MEKEISSASVARAVKELRDLDRCVIDSCAYINMRKAGFLDPLSKSLRLVTTGAVQEEVGQAMPEVRVDDIISEENADSSVIQLAGKLCVPIISDDKKVLLSAAKEGLPYFNSIMMLNFLEITGAVDSSLYDAFFERLSLFARYSEYVYRFAESVRNYKR